MKSCFRSYDILLPNNNVDLEKWAVIACDQFTSQPEYWKEVEEIVGDEPSTLNIVYPEVYLEETVKRFDKINQNCKKYIQDKTLVKTVEDGFVLVARTTESGTRLGLVGAVDLEHYDFSEKSSALIRATEQTVTERIPPRLKVRECLEVESPHVMLLTDDKKDKIIENLYKDRNNLPLLYDFDLMMNGGHITGYKIEGERARKLDEDLYNLQENSNNLFIVVGDGNHSLATAKCYWDNLKETLSEEERETHPARFALAELVNLHSEAMIFESIHRVMFNVNDEKLYNDFEAEMQKKNVTISDGDDLIFKSINFEKRISLSDPLKRLPVKLLQDFLDVYMKKNSEAKIDYIHGADSVYSLVNETSLGIVIKDIEKDLLFTGLSTGVLPRKTFSIGHAHEKRYYLECKLIVKD